MDLMQKTDFYGGFMSSIITPELIIPGNLAVSQISSPITKTDLPKLAERHLTQPDLRMNLDLLLNQPSQATLIGSQRNNEYFGGFL